MNTRFNTYDILKIAERVEQKELDFYNNAQQIFHDTALRGVCRDLGFWSKQQQKLWMNKRQALVNQLADNASHQDNNTGLPDPSAMAGLTWFGQRPNSAAKLRGVTNSTTLLQVAAKRGRDLIVFYQGLKAFALDRASVQIIEDIIAKEWQHLEYIDKLTDHEQVHPSVHTMAVA